MHKRCVLSILSAMTILLVSCAPSISRSGDYGKISVAVGGPSARGLETGWPNGTIPTFSSLTVTVSGGDMSTITASSSGSSGSLTIKIPAGTNRLVEVLAVPASGGGAPYFAMGYSGSATVDVGEGETVNVPIRLTLSETKIVLPSATGSIYSADSLTNGLDSASHSAAYLGESSDFEFDAYGRLFYTDPEMGLLRISSITDAGVEIDGSGAYDGLAYVASQGRLYYPNSEAIGYVDVASEQVGSIDIVSGELAGLGSVIAADEAAVYADGYLPTEESVICKISLNGTTITGIFTAGYDAIGLAPESGLEIKDMIVKDGILYIAARYVYSTTSSSSLHSCGKIIAVNTSTLTKLWEIGWNGDQIPQNENSPQLYGPVRFVGIAPKKLYVADEGFYWTGVSGSTVVNVDRVVEIDLDAHAISNSGILNAVAFFSDYSDQVWAC